MDDATKSDSLTVSGRPKLPLCVFVLWHPKFERGEELAKLLYGHLCNDLTRPSSRALRIPVRFRSQSALDANHPEKIELDAERAAIIALIDDEMVNDATWCEYVAGIHFACESAAAEMKGYPRHRVFPVSFSSFAFNLDSAIAEINFLRLHDLPEAGQGQSLLNGITHQLARLLLSQPQVGDEEQMRHAGPAPARVFLSHAKQGGLGLTESIRAYIASKTQLDTFFDAHDIPAGSKWKNVLFEEAGSGINSLLVLQTDAYSTREWCRIEALKAKLGWVPTVVVQAIEQAEIRSFPYLGNVPTIRWPLPVADSADPWAVVLGKLLYEVLRAAYFPKWVEYLASLHGVKRPFKPLPYPPELLTLLSMQRHEREYADTTFVYPDPPLGTEEVEILHEAEPAVRIITPMRIPLLARAQPGMLDGEGKPVDRSSYPLAGLTIGVSVSDVPKSELAARGLGPMHLEHAFWELTRQLLALGANVAYGGDHRVGGFTERLFDVVRTYTREEIDPTTRVLNYLAWPIHNAMRAADRNKVKDATALVDCPLPDDLKTDPIIQALKPGQSLPPDPAANRRIWARCLTAMRQKMNSEIDARILLGGRYGGIVDGKLDRFLGKYQGLTEEAHLAMTSGKPTFLLGGFGGCTRVIADALLAAAPVPLTLAYHTNADPVYKELVETCSLTPDSAIDYEQVRIDFVSRSVSGLNNGLSDVNNRYLFVSHEVESVLAEVVSALCVLASSNTKTT